MAKRKPKEKAMETKVEGTQEALKQGELVGSTGELAEGANVEQTEEQLLAELAALAIENLGGGEEVTVLVGEAIHGMPADRILSGEISKEDALGKLVSVCKASIEKIESAREQQQKDLEAQEEQERQEKLLAEELEKKRLDADQEKKDLALAAARQAELDEQEAHNAAAKAAQEKATAEALLNQSKYDQVNRFKSALTNVRAGIAISVDTMHRTHETCFNALRSAFDMKDTESAVEAIREILAFARSEADGVFHRSRAARHIGTLHLLSPVNYAEYRTLLSFITDYANRSASMKTTNWDNFISTLNPKTSEKTFRILSKAAGLEH